MLLRSSFLLVGAAFAFAAGSRVELEATASPKFRGLPQGWVQLDDVPFEDDGLELMFFIKQQNTELLEASLMSVSTPGSPHYGNHLSNTAIHDMVRPRQESIDAVTTFLESNGIVPESITPNSDVIQARVSIAQAEMLLSTRYHVMHHAATKTNYTRTRAYSLPSTVAAHVDFVCPTVHLPRPVGEKRATVKAPKAKPLSAGRPQVTNTPSHLRELYSIGTVEGKAPNNKMAVTAFLNQHYSVGDLKEFWRMFCDGITCGKGNPLVKGDGSLGIGSGIESMLDIESITGVAGNVEAEFWGYKGKSPDNKANEPFMKWLSQLANTSDADVPKIFSTSYGEDEDAWSLEAATRMNTEFQKAGARGISLLYAAGDEGSNCKDGKFVPETPGSSPWVTSVGGTTGVPEQAVGLSSGGFSNRWAQPSWQRNAVAGYFAGGGDKLPPASRGYNKSGRAYPDIAAQATDFTVVANRIPNPGVAGTSCATPTASGVIALLNDALLQAGKPVLGFLNPWIYGGSQWNDITVGSSEGCFGGQNNATATSSDGGWPAVQGWDAVTGMGTPNYKKLLTCQPFSRANGC